MDNNFYKRMAMASAFIAVISAGASTMPPGAGRMLKSEHGFEMIGRKGDKPETGRKAPSLLIDADRSGKMLKSPAKAEDNAVVLIYEDFSLWTEGSEADPVYTADMEDFWIDPDTRWDIASSRTKQPGWAGQALFCADGVCGLVYPDYGGFIQTPRMDYSGTVTLTARMKVSSTSKCKKANLTIGLLKGEWTGGSLLSNRSYVYPELPNDGEWHEVEFTYENEYGGSDCFFQINSYDEIFVDDVKVTVVCDFLPHPELKAATDFTHDGFTANWGEVAKASDYLLTCWRNVALSDEKAVFNESFENLNHQDNVVDTENPNFPKGWEIYANGADLMVSEGDETSDGKNALVLTADGQWIATPNTGSLITEASVKVRYISESDKICDPVTGDILIELIPAQFELEGWDGHKWCYTGASFRFSQSKEFKTWDFSDDAGGKYYRIRLVARDLAYSEHPARIAFDEFSVVTLPASEKEFAVKDEPVTGTSYVFTGLDAGSDYYYNVQSRNLEKGLYSGEPQKDMFAFGLPAPEVYEPSDVDPRGGYTANWEDAPKADEFCVENIRVFTASEDIEDFDVLEDAFSNLVGIGISPTSPLAFNNATLMSLDDYCDNIGWVGYLCGIAEGAIGGIGVQEYSLGGQIQTPYLSLGNDGGKYKVTISACGTTGDYLYVVNSNGLGGAIPLSEEYEEYTAEFEGGCDFDFLAFYTAYDTPFFINYINVTQNLKPGDKVLNIVETVRLEDNTYRFGNLERPDGEYSYAYDVFGIHTFLANTVWSPRSEVKYVDFSNSVKAIELDNAKVVALRGAVSVTASDNATAEIYAATGMKVASFTGSRTVGLPAGIYMVNVNGKTVKVMVR